MVLANPAYMYTVYDCMLVISLPKYRVYTVYLYGSGQPCIYVHRIRPYVGDFPAKNTVYIQCVCMVLANPAFGMGHTLRMGWVIPCVWDGSYPAYGMGQHCVWDGSYVHRIRPYVGDFPAKNTVYIQCVCMVLASRSHLCSATATFPYNLPSTVYLLKETEI